MPNKLRRRIAYVFIDVRQRVNDGCVIRANVYILSFFLSPRDAAGNLCCTTHDGSLIAKQSFSHAHIIMICSLITARLLFFFYSFHYFYGVIVFQVFVLLLMPTYVSR